MENIKYLKENDLIRGGYINIPITLYNATSYKGLTNDAILLYGILRNNSKLSAENGLIDNMGRVYVIAPLSYIMKTIRCSKNTARKILDELKKYLLIEFSEDEDTKKIRYIYLGEVEAEDIQKCKTIKNKKQKKSSDSVLEKKKDSIKKSTDNGLEREPDSIKKSTNKCFKKVMDGSKKSTSTGSNNEPLLGQNLNPNKNIYINTYKKGLYQEVSGECYPYYKEFDFED